MWEILRHFVVQKENKYFEREIKVQLWSAFVLTPRLYYDLLFATSSPSSTVTVHRLVVLEVD